jgi:hypothetical protein
MKFMAKRNRFASLNSIAGAGNGHFQFSGKIPILRKFWRCFDFILSKKNHSFRARLVDHCLGKTAFTEQAKVL